MQYLITDIDDMLYAKESISLFPLFQVKLFQVYHQ